MSLGWSIELDDGKFVKNAERAANSLVVLQGSLAKTRRAFLELEVDGGRALINLTKLSNDLGGAMGGALVAGAKLAAAAVVGLAYALDKFGDSAIEAFGERTSTLRTYTTLLGDATQAELEFYKAQQYSQKTDFTSATAEKVKKQLLVAGFRGKDLDAAFLAGGDIAASAENPNEAYASFARALAQIKNKGKLEQEELNQLSEGTGLGTRGVKEQLIKMLGLKDMAAYDKLQKKGKVTADQAIVAIERAVLAQLNTNKLGDYATGSAGSLTSLLSNKDEAFKNLLKSFDSETLPNVRAYKQALTEAGEALSVNTDAGQNLGLVLQDLSNSSLGLKTIWQEFSNGFLTSFAESYTAALREMSGTLDDVSDGFGAGALGARQLGEAIGQIGGIVARTVHLLEEMSAAVLELTSSPAARQVFEEQKRIERAHEGRVQLRFKQEGAGWASTWMDPNSEEALSMKQQGMLDEESAAKVGRQAGEKMGEQIVAGARAATRTHSPSDEMRDFARDLQAGLMLGLQPGAAGNQLAQQADAAAGGGDQYSIYINGSGGEPQHIADEVVRAIREIGRYSRNPGKALR